VYRNEIISIIESHSQWLKSGGKDGVRGYLQNMDLKQSDFSRLNLSEICLDGSNVDDCNFQWSIMERAKTKWKGLSDADLIRRGLKKLSEGLRGIDPCSDDDADDVF